MSQLINVIDTLKGIGRKQGIISGIPIPKQKILVPRGAKILKVRKHNSTALHPKLKKFFMKKRTIAEL